jgi:hypothetical protein
MIAVKISKHDSNGERREKVAVLLMHRDHQVVTRSTNGRSGGPGAHTFVNQCVFKE